MVSPQTVRDCVAPSALPITTTRVGVDQHDITRLSSVTVRPKMELSTFGVLTAAATKLFLTASAA